MYLAINNEWVQNGARIVTSNVAHNGNRTRFCVYLNNTHMSTKGERCTLWRKVGFCE